jgi:tellurite methyltransferase
MRCTSARSTRDAVEPESTPSRSYAWVASSVRSGRRRRGSGGSVPLSEPIYDERYSRPGLYWGTKPTQLARDVVRLARSLPHSPRTLVDLGCGEGRDSIYFARRGYRVLAVDISSVGVQKARQRASRLGVAARFLVGDIRTYRLSRRVDVVFCSGALNNLPHRIRASRFKHFKANTAPGGINAMNADVPKPYIPRQTTNPWASPFRSGELLGYYWDWQILESGQVEFISDASGVPHRKAMDVVIARKPTPGLC